VGEIEKADSAYKALDETTESPQFVPWHALFEYQRGDEEAARDRIAALAEEYGTQARMMSFSRRLLGRLELVHGRVKGAEALLTEAADLDRDRGDAGAALEHGLETAAFLLIAVEDTARALQELERALSQNPPDQLPVLDRPWVWAATIAARAGDADRARALIEQRDAEVSPRFLEIEQRYEHNFRAWLALAEGDANRALAELRQQPTDGCPRCLPAEFAHLFDAMGQADSAIARYEQYLGTPSNFQLFLDALVRAPAHETLGQLYDEKGDLENAALHYAQFVELWEDADPELQPRVAAARVRLEEIVRERG
jgi:tetratricopeptide (TPR) repeat protein